MRTLKILIAVLLVYGKLQAQNFVNRPSDIKASAFDKKILWGFTFTQSWSTIKGNSLPSNYFSKPSLGLQVSAEYYPLNFLGFSLGLGYQQRGAGIKNVNTTPVDSTYRERLRFNSFEIPISVILRTPKDVIKGLRFSGSIGVVPIINRNSRDSKISLEPNIADLDNVKDVSSNFFKSDFALQLSVGPEIDMAGSQVIKVQFYYSQGTNNVYTAGQGTGHNQNVGVRLGWMF